MKTKIVATYGPSLFHPGILSRAMKYVDVFRINFSHAKEDDAEEYIADIRSASKKAGKEVAILADLPGPKMRFGKLPSAVTLKKGESVRLKFHSKDPEVIPLDYDISGYLREGSIIAVGDGYMSLRVNDVSGGFIECTATKPGSISSRKGINIINGNVSAAPPTTEDVRLARFSKKNGVDFMGLSFVREPHDIDQFRRKVGDAYVISKIERSEALENIDGILGASDAIMVARGDLAFDVPISSIPVAQLKLIGAARRHRKPVIVATQMLASMVSNPSPTRAEVNDIATAVLSGADCIMLSEESAVGKYPIESIRMLHDSATSAEAVARGSSDFKIADVGDSVAFAAAEIADNYNTTSAFVPTQTGASAIKLSALRPHCDIIAMSNSERVRRKLNLYWGVRSEAVGKYGTVDQMLALVGQSASRRRVVRYIVLSGTPNQKGTTNTLKYIN